jgi:hypothetical protein
MVYAMSGSLFVALALIGSSLSDTQPEVRLEKVSIHLFLEKSGEMSADVTSIPGFFTRNFAVFGEGMPDDERFHSFLIKVWFSADAETFRSGEQARLVIRRAETGRKVLESSIENVYVGPNRHTARPFLVSGHECEPLVVEVRSHDKLITNSLPFRCAE